ncbi:MAG: hypothetical protein Q8P20_00545 [bacterium]|nr:hypothetical protein [bacterium]
MYNDNDKYEPLYLYIEYYITPEEMEELKRQKENKEDDERGIIILDLN